MCDRVAIMVSGQLRLALKREFLKIRQVSGSQDPADKRRPPLSNRCIGSIQHLKGKYGRGYSLEVKLREELTGLQQVALLHKEIRRIFPHAARQER